MSRVIVVKAVYDADAGVWLTECADIHGLRIEAPTLERLVDRIPGAVEDLLEGRGDHEIWFSPITNKPFTVDGDIRSRHTANGTLQDAGLPKAF